MKVTSLHWVAFLGLMVVAVFAANIVADKVLDYHAAKQVPTE